MSDTVVNSAKVSYIWAANVRETRVYSTGGAPIVANESVDDLNLPITGYYFNIKGSFEGELHPAMSLQTNIAATCTSPWGPYGKFTITAGSLSFAP